MIGPYGLSPYGMGHMGGPPGAVSIASAWATSTRTILVNTNGQALGVDPFDPGDALNPSTWVVTRLDAMTDLTPIFVRHMGGGTSFEVTVMEELGSHEVEHRIGSVTLLSVAGALITAPYQATFQGVAVATDPVGAVRRRPLLRDLANPFRSNPRTSLLVSDLRTSGGDLDTEIDAAVTRKAIYRRVTTIKGSIRHLPNYGMSYGVKRLLPSGDREAMRVEAETQVMQERGVKRTRAGLQVFANGVVILRIAAMTSTAHIALTVRRNNDGSFVEQ